MKNRHVFSAICMAVFVLLVAVGAAGEEATSENDATLGKWLKRFPQADLNGDGVLTRQEADTVRKQMQKQRAKSQAQKGIAPTEENIRYGDHERHVFDFWKAESDAATPVLIYWHGGGFSGGDKSKFRTNSLLKKCIDAGISVVSGNYRLIDTAPFPAAMMDGARTVQYLRHNAGRFNIDPSRIALSGGSAGGNMSVWIAVHDDMAESESSDPVARMSTRVTCVVGFAAQTSNDPEYVLEHIGGSIDRPHPSTKRFFGIKEIDELWTPPLKKLAYEASAINFATADDPPMLLKYGGDLTPTPLPDDVKEGVRIHHPRFGELFQEKYKTLGVICHLYYKSKPAPPNTEIEFLRKQFRM